MPRSRRRPERPLPTLGDLPPEVRHAIEDLILRNRRDIRDRSAPLIGDDWLEGLLEGLYIAGSFTSRDHRNAVQRAIRQDVLDTLTE